MTRDLSTRLNDETEKAGARIGKAFAELARKMRRRADKVKAAMVKSKKGSKSVVLQRRFEVYANAAHDLERVLMEREASAGSISPLKGSPVGVAQAERAVP